MTGQFNAGAGRPAEWADERREISNVCLYGTVWETPAEAGGKLGQTPPAGSKVNTHLLTPIARAGELKELAAGETPRIIHCDPASDIFAPTVRPDHVYQILDAMRGAPHHAYVLSVAADPQLLKYANHMPRNV